MNAVAVAGNIQVPHFRTWKHEKNPVNQILIAN